jgi:CHAD domain-containing protein
MHLKSELQWLAGRLAPARDFYMMQAKLRRRRLASAAPTIVGRVAQSRAAAFDAARAAVDSSRTRKLLLDILQWIELGEWAIAPAPQRPATREFAEQVLTRRAARIVKKAGKLEELNAERRHRLRIAIKKLYYAIGFFDSLFGDRGTAKHLPSFKRKLKDLLDSLGALNDIAVHQRLAMRLARVAPAAVKARELRAAKALIERDKAEVATLLKAAIKAGRKLAGSNPFAE